ncbi:hypothetical protein KEM56_002724 [Ascosphaera pollenicola]|nr:hypothetical protein KEM56_002724 [Ascosphaera pollenicola]
MTFTTQSANTSNERPTKDEYAEQQDRDAEDISSDEDSDVEATEEEDDDSNMEPISSSNIIEGGRRTRGKRIDFSQAAANEKENEEEEDEDEEYVPN